MQSEANGSLSFSSSRKESLIRWFTGKTVRFLELLWDKNIRMEENRGNRSYRFPNVFLHLTKAVSERERSVSGDEGRGSAGYHACRRKSQRNHLIGVRARGYQTTSLELAICITINGEWYLSAGHYFEVLYNFQNIPGPAWFGEEVKRKPFLPEI